MKRKPALSAFLVLIATLAGLANAEPATNAVPGNVTLTNTTTDGSASEPNRTEITSTQLRMDTEKKIAYFDGNVLVVDPRFQLRATRLIVFLNTVGSGMDRAEAYEDVIIVQDSEKRKAYAQKAVYTAADGKIVLTGNPRLEGEKGATSGESITIFRSNNTVLIEGSTKTILNLSLPEPTKTNAPPVESTNAPPPEATPATNATPKPESN